MPGPCDDHTCNIYKDYMILFGGFRNGERSSEVFSFDLQNTTWTHIETKGLGPCPRAGQTAVVYNESLVIFGGTETDNKRLNDTWILNLESFNWTPLNKQFSSLISRPISRSGATACLYNNHLMVIFGGIHDVTKELDDVCVLNLETHTWS